jgi:hypothetical protein
VFNLSKNVGRKEEQKNGERAKGKEKRKQKK